MKQSKLESHLESTFNIASGFIISYLVWRVGVHPAIDRGYLSMDDAFLITCIFTISSYLRSYFWRRFFNAEIHKLVHRFVMRR